MRKYKTMGIYVLVFLFILCLNLNSQIIKDFRVNGDTVGIYTYNSQSVVEIFDGGNAIVVWEDLRNSVVNLYGQVYDNTGDPIGTNFKVSTNSGNLSETRPAISSYGDSLFVVWESGYSQWLLSDGSQSGLSFSLQNDPMNFPDAAVNDSGVFVVWYSDDYEIFLKRFNFNGDSLSPRVVVNDDTTGDQLSPNIATNDNGNLVVVWQDFRNGDNFDIYGQLFDQTGLKIDTNILLNEEYEDTNQVFPCCALDSAGNFVVVWEGARSGDRSIYARQFDSLGHAWASGFRVNTNAYGNFQFNPYCATDKSGSFIVVWMRDYNIYGQRFDNMSNFVGNNFQIDQCSGSGFQDDPVISMNENNFVVSWSDTRYGNSIYKRRFSNDGTAVENEVKVNDVDGTLDQNFPAVAMGDDGSSIITWYDEKSGIFFRRYDSLGNPLSGDFQVSLGSWPDVSVAGNGSFVIIYSDMPDVNYQMFNPEGNPIGSPSPVNDTSGGTGFYSSIDMNESGSFIIAWTDFRSGCDIFAQRFDSLGDTIGINYEVDDDPGESWKTNVSVALTALGKCLISWSDVRNGNYDIYARLFDAEGNPVGTDFRIDNDAGTSDQVFTDAAPLPGDNFIIVWEDERSPSGIYAQVLDSAGSLVGTNFKVSDAFGYRPSLGVSPSGGFVVAWHDSSSGDYDIYAQRYNPDYSPDNVNYRVNNEIEGVNPDQRYADIATNGTNIMYTWQDAKWQRGYDIAAKLVRWDLSSIDEEILLELSTMILPNIPNPFINSTIIRFQTDKKQAIKIKLFDLSGRLINTLLDGVVEAGIYDLEWKGTDAKGKIVPVGLYFCRLEAEEKIFTQKIVRLK
jgi:hypothetical protein